MAYDSLKTAVAQVIRANGQKEITGPVLDGQLNAIIDALADGGYAFQGVATTSTVPGTPDHKVFYIGGAGSYSSTNWGANVTVPRGSIVVFYYDTTWHNSVVRTAGDGFVNVNDINGQSAAYNNVAAARAAVPAGLRKPGLQITYLLASGWMEDQFNGADVADWGVADNWKVIGPVSVSQNTLSIGGNYAGEISTTYDVTLHNSGATFASLEALLSDVNLNTLIPLAVRKSGMSIKFVQSSDNKYAQYFLTKNEWSSSEDDWEKMNLEEEVSQLDQKLIKLSGWGDSDSLAPNVGDTYYKTYEKELRRRMSNGSMTVIPFRDGAIYTYNNVLYIWNGTDLVDVEQDVKDNVEKNTMAIGVKSNKVTAIANEIYINYIYGDFKAGMKINAKWSGVDISKNHMLNLQDNTGATLEAIYYNVQTEIILPRDTTYLRITRAASAITIGGDVTFSLVFGLTKADEEVKEYTDNLTGFTGAFDEDITSSVTNPYTMRPTYTYFIPSTDGTGRAIRCIIKYLNVGDVINIHCIGLNSATLTVIARVRNANDFSSDNLIEALVNGTDTTGEDNTYSYTVTEAGYYAVSLNTAYNGSSYNMYAKIAHPQRTGITDNKNEIDAIIPYVVKPCFDVGIPVNVFGDVLPAIFKNKLFNSAEDVEIVCVGDSITGMTERCGSTLNPEFLPPGMTYKHWTYLLWERLALNRPVCNRLDAEVGGVAVFSKVGTFSWQDFSGGSDYVYDEHSAAADTFVSDDIDASATFLFDADTYEKCNVVFSKEPDGADSIIRIAEGNGKMLASLDKTNWVEANGFAITQTTTGIRERHRRCWMKKVSGITGNIHITYERNDADTTHKFYFWGIEYWNEASVFLTNIGKGGYTTAGLNNILSDVTDRNPDLLIFEMPLANETKLGNTSLATLKSNYQTYLNNIMSNNVEVLVVLPHGRSAYFDGNRAINYVTSGAAHMLNHLQCNVIFNYVRGILSASYDGHYGCVDLMEQLYNEGLAKGYTIEEWLSEDKVSTPTMTIDGIHLNELGSRYWNKYLSPIFQ